MKKITLILFAALCLAFTPASALTTAERTIVLHVQQLNVQQKQQLEDVRAKLVWTDKELKDTEPKIAAIGAERDDFKSKYESDHEALLKKEAALLRRDILIGILGFMFLLMVIWKFKLYRFIPGLGLAP